MDLYSAAKRMARPFRFTHPDAFRELSLASRGLIGNGITCALVRPDGAIDWLCFPRFDSPSVFAALLDDERGGYTAITPGIGPYESLQRYDPDTNVLETLFTCDRLGVVRLVDYMPWTNDPRAAIHEVHRRIECVEGSMELDVVFDPRFGFGQSETRIDREEHGLIARGAAGERLVTVLGGPAKWERFGETGVKTRIRLRAGERQWMVLAWDVERPDPISAYRPFEHLRDTREHWREWARQLRYDGPWRHQVLRSALALKLLLYAPTGAMVAAPTTSLPEWIGGARNWDYRYSWTRDAAMAVRATNLIGFTDESREFFYFVRDTLSTGTQLQVMYAIDGSLAPEEKRLDHLAGFRGSRPVRIGNAARDQLQLDTAGALLDAAYHYERFGGRLPLQTWRMLESILHVVAQRWREPDHGIWEPRREKRHNLHSKLTCWLAFHRGISLARRFAQPRTEAFCRVEAERVRQDILHNGVDPTGSHFIAAYGVNEPDAALLQLPILKCFQAREPLVLRTIDWLRDELGTGRAGFLRRYRTDDGLEGPEGAFLLCGFWMSEALALANRIEEAEEVLVAHIEASNHLGLLAEEIHPLTREQLGNFPQAFSHLGLINAAIRIDRALRMRDEGDIAAPHLVDPDPEPLPLDAPQDHSAGGTVTERIPRRS